MRKAAQIIAVTALVILAGCRTAEVAYEADAKVSPDP